MRIGSLFSGAGGLDMAVEEVFGGTTVWHSEIDKAASKVLAHRWPGVLNLGDISEINWDSVPPVDVLCGGFPCQDVSSAGRRAGIKDGTRSGLWAVFAEAIDWLHPQFVVIENVRGLLSAAAHRVEPDEATVGDRAGRPVLRAAGAVLGDLADLGYDAQWATFAAADIGAPHRRERVFIVATDATRNGRDEGRAESAGIVGRSHVAVGGDGPAADAGGDGLSWGAQRHLQPPARVEASRRDDADRRAVADGGDHRRPRRLAPNPLLPTPRTRDGKGATASRSGDNKHDLPSALADPDLTGPLRAQGKADDTGKPPSPGAVSLLPTPAAADGQRGQDFARAGRDGSGGDDLVTLVVKATKATAWGKYEPAIRRWEHLTGPAPAPTEPNKNGNPRLSAAFSQWLMGWPDGWVTDPAIGLSRNDQLRIVGNGVVPAQAAAAIRYLLTIAEVAA
jgi:DNA (cytosine-5)-methyltransferase 1